MERPRIAIRGGKGGGESCPYCHDGLSGRGAVCATCLAVHHVECWLEHGRCAGCGWTKALMPPEAVPAATATPAPDVPAATASDPQLSAGPAVWVTPLCDLAEACLLLGAREAEVRRLVASGHLPARQDGERLVFDRWQVTQVRSRLQGLRRRDARQEAARRAGDRIATRVLWAALVWVVLAPLGIAFVLGGPPAALGVLGFDLLFLGLAVLRARRRGRGAPPGPPAP